MSSNAPVAARFAAERVQSRVDHLLTSGAPLEQTLSELVRIVEQESPSGVLGSILVLDDDGRHLRHGGAPSLPEAYNAAIDGLEIGPDVGSCGTAAYTNSTVSVYDIDTNPLWANFRDLAKQHGLRACWSTPIHGSDGRVVGTFANYYRVVRDPSPADRELTDMITRAAAKAIEHERERHTAAAGAPA